MKQNKTFILLHGLWHQGSAWEAIVKYLKAQGHLAYAPTILGCGNNNGNPKSIQEIIAYLKTYKRQHNIDKFHLVAHSYGGMVAQSLAAYMPESVQTIIYVNAIIPKIRQPFINSLPKEFATNIKRFCSKKNSRLPFVVWNSNFVNKHKTAKKLFKQVSPSAETLLYLHNNYQPTNKPSVFISARNDDSLPPNFWRIMQRNAGANYYLKVAGCHEILLLQPKKLTQLILQASDILQPYYKNI